MKSIHCEFCGAAFELSLALLSISQMPIWQCLCWLSLDRASVSLLFMENWFVVSFWHKMAAVKWINPWRQTGCWRMKCLHSCHTSAFTFSDAPACEVHLYGSNHNAISFRIMSVVSTTSHHSLKEKVLLHVITYCHHVSLWRRFTFRGVGSSHRSIA